MPLLERKDAPYGITWSGIAPMSIRLQSGFQDRRNKPYVQIRDASVLDDIHSALPGSVGADTEPLNG